MNKFKSMDIFTRLNAVSCGSGIEAWLFSEAYDDVVIFMQTYKGRTPYKDFIYAKGILTDRHDGVCFMADKLWYGSLNAAMYEIAKRG
ncbi:hypothetical protein [Cloacibacillus porcorum]